MLRGILVGILAAIGALALIVLGLIWFVPSLLSKTMPDGASVVGSFLSPDRKYKAVVFNENGGGGFAPYCFDFVSVAPEAIADRDAWPEHFKVFTAACGSLMWAHWGDDIKWKSANALQITFDPTVGARGTKMTLKGQSADGKVSIMFTSKN